MAEHEGQGFSKRVVKLPDGRYLIYYEFGPSPAPAEAPAEKLKGPDRPEEA